jgi:hypothetical protein
MDQDTKTYLERRKVEALEKIAQQLSQIRTELQSLKMIAQQKR